MHPTQYKCKDVACDFEVLVDFPHDMPEKQVRKLCHFFQPIPHDPCLAEIVLFNITGDSFGVPFRLVWLVAVIHIIGANAIQGHIRPAVKVD